MHVKKGQLKPSVIRRADLAAGELSVWRAGSNSASDVEPVAQKIDARFTPGNNQIDRLLGVYAREVRAVPRDHTGRRSFSLLDDTRIDVAGNREADHATISPCRELLDDAQDLTGPVMEGLVNQLYLLLKDSVVWTTPATPAP